MNAMQKPVIHLPLDEIRLAEGEVFVSPNLGSQSTGDATVHEQVRVLQDPDLGSCLQLTGGWLELAAPPESDSLGEITSETGFTVALWIRCDAAAPYQRVVAIEGENDFLYVAVATEADAERWSGVTFEVYHGPAGQEVAHDSLLPMRTWTHLAATRGPDGTMSLYVDGVLQKSERSEETLPLAGAWTRLTLGDSLGGFFDGAMAHLRVYAAELGAPEIADLMVKDRAHMAALRKSYPLEFDLYTVYETDHVRSLFIEAPGVGEPLELRMTNATAQSLSFDPSLTELSSTDYHLQLRFRKDVVASAVLGALRQGSLTLEGWAYAASGREEGGREDWISFRSTGGAAGPVRLPKGESALLTIPGFSAAARFGSRNTRVEVRYANLLPEGAGLPPYRGSVLRFMSIHSHLGQKDVPLAAGVLGSDTLLNDGTTANTLTLRIFNLDPGKPVALTTAGADPAAPSRFVLRVAGELAMSAPEAGAHPDLDLNENKAEVDAGGFTYRFSVTEARSEYTIRLDKWHTGAENGAHQLTLEHENIPGFQDGRWTIPVQLGPEVVRRVGLAGGGHEDRVGIGVDPPAAKLHVKGGLTKLESGLQVRGSAQLTGPSPLTIEDERQYPNTDGSRGALVINNPGLGATGFIRNEGEFGRPRLCIGSTLEGALIQRIDGQPGKVILFWDGSGNVGIGLPNDSEGNPPKTADERLHVNGNIKVEGRLTDKSGAVMPVGAIIAYGGDGAPAGWLPCDGRAIPTGAQYSDLRTLVGATTPDLRSRFVVGAGPGNGTSLSAYSPRQTGGEERHGLTIVEMPGHTHSGATNRDGSHQHTGQRNHRADNDDNDCWGNYLGTNPHDGGNYRKNESGPTVITAEGSEHSHAFMTQPAGGSQPHENRPPYFALTYIIKY